MSARRLRQRCATATALFVGVTLPLLAGVQAAASPHHTSTSSADAALPISVVLGGISPSAPQPGGTLRITGRLSNVGLDTVSKLSLALDLSHTSIGDRGTFQNYADNPTDPLPAGLTAVDSAQVSVSQPALDPGQSASFTVTAKVDELLPLQAWRVYEMALVASGQTPETASLGASTVGRLRTFFPYAPVGITGTGSQVQLAWVWPLVDRPHRTTDTTWTDDSLATELRPNGRLGGLVAAGAAAESQHSPPPAPPPKRKHGKHPVKQPPARPKPPVNPVPLTWAVDPMLVDEAGHMEGRYQVGLGTKTTPGAGTTAAKAWLAALRSAVGGGQVLALPYGDPDITAADRVHLGTAVQLATTAGRDLLHSRLGATPLDYAWPPDGFLDVRAFRTLVAAGVTTFVLSGDAFRILGDNSETPSAHVQVQQVLPDVVPAEPYDELLSDPVLTSVVDAGAANPSDGPLEIQRTVSELLMIQSERPFDPRDIVIAPDRRWAPTPGYARRLLEATGRVPWVQPIRLDQVLGSPVSNKTIQRGPLVYPASERAAELPTSYLRNVASLRRRLEAFSSIFRGGRSPAGAFNSGVLGLLSSAWRNDLFRAGSDRNALQQTVNQTMGKVRIASSPGSLVTLTSHSGRVPVTVTNDLSTPVNVEVRIDPTTHLKVKNAHVVRTIPPHSNVPVDVRATAQNSGVFALIVRLYTPGPVSQPYGPGVELRVRSTAYGTTALLITGGATGVLLLTVAVRLARRARAARRAAHTPA